MNPGIYALIMLGILVITIMIGFPVAFTLMALGVGFGYYAYYQPGTEFFDNRVFSLLTHMCLGRRLHARRGSCFDPRGRATWRSMSAWRVKTWHTSA